MYDAIVIGARCAGASAAIHLSKLGHKVLMLDKATFPKDTLSTHFVWARGSSYLNRLGVLNKILEKTPSGREINMIIEGVSLTGEVPLKLLEDRFQALHADDSNLTQTYFSARRYFLDKLLIDEAVKVGVEFREGFSVEGLLFNNNHVIGIKGRTKDGRKITEQAKVVLGADGKRSILAKFVKAQREEVRSACTFAAYSYFSGFNLGKATIQQKGRIAFGIVPTNNNANMTLVFGPKEFYDSFRQNREENFFKALRYVNPEIAEIVSSGKQEESFYMTDDQAAFIRNAAGPGYALLGDAASFKDQCTASGMTHAFRDADLAATEIHKGLTGKTTIDEALKEYARKRHNDSFRYYDFVSTQAEMNPTRADELQVFEALQGDQEQTNRFIAMYGDTLPVNKFFSNTNITKILNNKISEERDYTLYNKQLLNYYKNPFKEDIQLSKEDLALSRTCVDFAQPVGKNLLKRTEDYNNFVNVRNETETFQFSRTLMTFPGPNAKLFDDHNREIDGINFASQDYLSLGAHPAIQEAAQKALQDFGPHSAGSPMVIGNTTLVHKLEQRLAEMLNMKHVMIFPTGFAAGFGSIIGLVRPQDHIVMDRLSHACLYQGAYASTRKIHRHPHLNVETAKGLLKEIREKDKRNGILLITEGLFSMDSDSPDLKALQEACHEYDATLFVDVAHDFGATGPDGTGQIGVQKMLGKIDLVMGSFSKTFATNGGFLATNNPAAKQYIKMYGNPYIFSNAISPMQTAVALKSAQIVQSEKGEELRSKLFDVVHTLRNGFHERGTSCLGNPSAIVPVPIGDEKVARIAHRLLQRRNIAAMILEYPVVATGSARFRLQVMASHTKQQASIAVKEITEVIEEATSYIDERNRPKIENIPIQTAGGF